MTKTVAEHEKDIDKFIEDMKPTIRTFETGANRNSDEGKLDYEAYFSPLVLGRVAEYMLKHSHLEDGTLRPGDNWQRGMPLGVYMKCLWRHFFDAWAWHRDPLNLAKTVIEDVLCGVIFNASGYLHEIIKERLKEPEAERGKEMLQKLTGEKLLREKPRVEIELKATVTAKEAADAYDTLFLDDI